MMEEGRKAKEKEAAEEAAAAPKEGLKEYDQAVADLELAMKDSENAYKKEREAAEKVLSRGRALS